MSDAPNGRPPALYAFDGKRLPLSEWAKIAGVPIQIVRGRLSSGWSLERALTGSLERAPRARAGRSCSPTGAYGIEKAFSEWVASPPPRDLIATAEQKHA
jgi:hypothetical protein